MKTVAPLLSAVWICAAAISACSSAENGETSLTALDEPFAVPSFDLPGPDGRRFRWADYRGKPLLVNFWATWCAPCRAEMPALQRAWEELRGEGVALLTINMGESAETIEAYLMEVGLTLPVAMDLDSSAISAWSINGVPTTYVVDPAGRIVYVATGEREWDDPALLDQVRALREQTE